MPGKSRRRFLAKGPTDWLGPAAAALALFLAGNCLAEQANRATSKPRDPLRESAGAKVPDVKPRDGKAAPGKAESSGFTWDGIYTGGTLGRARGE
jgi:hypothetical protein